jgi:thioredoxin-related protein
MKKHLIIIITFLFSWNLLNAQSVPGKTKEEPGIKWYGFEEGMKLAAKKKLPVIVDVYTEWCGWCKKMDNETFRNQSITEYISKYFIAVKLNAEDKNPINYLGKTYVNPNPAASRSTHQLPGTLAKQRIGYPTYIYLDSAGKTITLTQGYLQADDMLPLLKYIGSGSYKTMTWKEFTGLK